MLIDKRVWLIFFCIECYDNETLLNKIANIIKINYNIINCIYDKKI